MGFEISEKMAQADAKSYDSNTSNSNIAEPPVLESSDAMTQVPGYSATLTWTSDEERRARLKTDFFILPFIVLLFCFMQFDRTNIANALTDTLRHDIHVGNKEINLAQTLFTVGFVLTELPFNMISKIVGPERFLPVTMVLWGIATWSQVFLKNASGFYAVRFFLGALEGGYIPGMALYISRYYTNQELGLRFAIFWASNSIAGALGGPLSIGLLSLRGQHGLKGWQWLFLIGMNLFACCSYDYTFANLSRGCLDLLLRSSGMVLPSTRTSGAQVFLRTILEYVQRPRSFNYCFSCHSQRPNKSFLARETSASFSYRNDIQGLAIVRSYRGCIPVDDDDCPDEHICAINH